MTVGMRRITILAAAVVFAAAGLASCATEKSYREPDALARLIAEKAEPYILVDVRTPEEYAGGHIPTAVNIPVSTIAKNLPTEDRSALVIVYCASGRRSASARAALEALGFTRVVDFGGISRWEGETESESAEGG
jgi:phage shock protein E